MVPQASDQKIVRSDPVTDSGVAHAGVHRYRTPGAAHDDHVTGLRCQCAGSYQGGWAAIARHITELGRPRAPLAASSFSVAIFFHCSWYSA